MPAPDDAEFLRLYLAERDVSCPKCGYNLRGCVSGMCSECGAGIRLHVHPVIKLPASHTTGTVGLTSGVVLGFVVGLIGFDKGPAWILTGLAAFLVSVAGLLVWDKAYFMVRRRRREMIPYLAAGAWVGAAISLTLIGSMIVRWL